MKKWLIPLTILVISLATAGGVTAFALHDSGDMTSVPEGSDTPDSSAVCAPGVTDCVDTDVPTSDDGGPGNEIADGELHPDVPREEEEIDDGSTSQPPIRSDEDIGPDDCNLVHNLTACSEDALDELDELKVAGIEPDVSGSASGETPTVEPSDVTEDGRVVPIGTFDQDGDSGTTSGSGEAENAPIADGVAASAVPPVTPAEDSFAD